MNRWSAQVQNVCLVNATDKAQRTWKQASVFLWLLPLRSDSRHLPLFGRRFLEAVPLGGEPFEHIGMAIYSLRLASASSLFAINGSSFLMVGTDPHRSHS